MEIALFIIGAVIGWLIQHLYSVRSTAELKALLDQQTVDVVRQVIEFSAPESLPTRSPRTIRGDEDFPIYASLLDLEPALNELVRLRAQEALDDAIHIRILGVYGRYSIPWISDVVPRILRDFPRLRACIDILIVDPRTLRSHGVTQHVLGDTAAEARLKVISEFGRLSDSVQNRLSVSLGFYRNVPHWHGVMIGDNDLYLANVSWDPTDEEALLRVGDGGYVHYTPESHTGLNRIVTFRTWFRYYCSDSDSEST